MRFMTTAALICTTLCLTAGCGSDLPPIGSLTGTVTLDGKPFTSGSLMFNPTGGGRPSVAAIDENGTFKAMYNLDTPGALIGTHTISFEAEVPATDEEDEFKPYAPPKEGFKVSPSQVKVENSGTEIALTLEKR